MANIFEAMLDKNLSKHGKSEAKTSCCRGNVNEAIAAAQHLSLTIGPTKRAKLWHLWAHEV
jgi:hypothetical protein